jgi:translation initiation factor IF-1
MGATDRRLGVIGGAAFKVPCRAATTANITLNGLQTIDGVSLASGDRVLVKNQSTASQNGIYTADSGDWSRARDFNGPGDAVKGTLVLVVEGSVSASTVYQLTTSSPVIGSTSLTFAVTGTPALAYASAFIQTLLDDANAAAARATLDVRSVAESVPATLTTAGDILSHDGSVYIRVPRGDSDQYLGVTGTALAWKDLIIDLTTAQVTGVLPRANGGFTPSQITASLGADVNTTATGTYFDGPSIAQGSSGTWLVSGSVTIINTVGGDNVNVKLWDGTNVIASAAVALVSVSGTYRANVHLSGIAVSPAGNLRISVSPASRTDGAIAFNQSGNSKDSTISAIRIA